MARGNRRFEIVDELGLLRLHLPTAYQPDLPHLPYLPYLPDLPLDRCPTTRTPPSC